MTASSASPSSDFDLRPGEVHLWLARAADTASLDTSVLSESERARSSLALGRCWLRHLLSRYGDTDPEAWVFSTGEHGKPALEGQDTGLEFNLSHSGEWLAASVSVAAPVGVDVQLMDPERRVQRLARRYFSAAERAALEAMAPDDYYRHFYRLWSLKEAWTKARGASLPGALGNVGFVIEDRTLTSLPGEATAESCLWLLELPGYSLALCALARGLQLRIRGWPAGIQEPPVTASLGVS